MHFQHMFPSSFYTLQLEKNNSERTSGWLKLPLKSNSSVFYVFDFFYNTIEPFDVLK